MKIILIKEIKPTSPIFVESYLNISLNSNYLHIGSYVTTVVAYEPLKNQLIKDYSIVTQTNRITLVQEGLFTIEPGSGNLN